MGKNPTKYFLNFKGFGKGFHEYRTMERSERRLFHNRFLVLA